METGNSPHTASDDEVPVLNTDGPSNRNNYCRMSNTTPQSTSICQNGNTVITTPPSTSASTSSASASTPTPTPTTITTTTTTSTTTTTTTAITAITSSTTIMTTPTVNAAVARKMSTVSGRRTTARATHSGHRHTPKNKMSSKVEKCRSARILAMQLLSQLMQRQPESSTVSEQQEPSSQRHDGERIEISTMKENTPKGSASVETMKRNMTLSNSGTITGEMKGSTECHLSPNALELVPEEENSIPQILCSLREIALTGASLDGSPSSKDAPKSSDTSSPTTSSNSGKTGTTTPVIMTSSANKKGMSSSPNEVEGQWEEIRMHFETVHRLVHNRDELASTLNTVLGVDWCLESEGPSSYLDPFSTGEMALPPSQASGGSSQPITSRPAISSSSVWGKKKGTEQQEKQKQQEHEQQEPKKQNEQKMLIPDEEVKTIQSTLNYEAHPFESQVHTLSSSPSLDAAPYYFSGGYTLGSTPTTTTTTTTKPPVNTSQCVSSSPPPLLNGNGPVETSENTTAIPASSSSPGTKATTPPTASSSSSSPPVTFKLESREDMLRRRTAAAAAAAAAAASAHYSPGNSNSYYGNQSRSSWSYPVSPLVTFMNPSVTQPQCPFDYLLVLDFEATCEENTPPQYLHEIIEFPIVLVDVKLQRVVAEFHRYVKPKVQPILSDFCRGLTGIQQEVIDAAAPLDDVIRQFERWYTNTISPGARVMIATDGPTDLREFMYANSVRRQGIRFPSIFYQWIDVKRAFAHFFNCQQGKIKAMLDVLKCPIEGRLHSGIDDARNIAKIVIRMLQMGCSFCEIPLSRLPYGVTNSVAGLAAPTTV